MNLLFLRLFSYLGWLTWPRVHASWWCCLQFWPCCFPGILYTHWTWILCRFLQVHKFSPVKLLYIFYISLGNEGTLDCKLHWHLKFYNHFITFVGCFYKILIGWFKTSKDFSTNNFSLQKFYFIIGDYSIIVLSPKIFDNVKNFTCTSRTVLREKFYACAFMVIIDNLTLKPFFLLCLYTMPINWPKSMTIDFTILKLP